MNQNLLCASYCFSLLVTRFASDFTIGRETKRSEWIFLIPVFWEMRRETNLSSGKGSSNPPFQTDGDISKTNECNSFQILMRKLQSKRGLIRLAYVVSPTWPHGRLGSIWIAYPSCQVRGCWRKSFNRNVIYIIGEWPPAVASTQNSPSPYTPRSSMCMTDCMSNTDGS
jgi:hypothetical protein